MRDSVGPYDIANEIMMRGSLFDGTFLIVEGITDMRLYGKFTDVEKCDIVIAHSKSNVLASMKELKRRKDGRKILGIVDSDLDRIKDLDRYPPIFPTDERDAECMIIRSDALKKVMWEYADKEKLLRFVTDVDDLRTKLLNACSPIGILMYISDINDYGLSFKDMDYSQFISRRSLKNSVTDMIDHVLYSSPNSQVSRSRLTSEFNALINRNIDPWDLCRGHDMVAVLAMGLRDIFGSYNCRYIKEGELGGALRIAYSDTMFINTHLYKETKEWCVKTQAALWSL